MLKIFCNKVAIDQINKIKISLLKKDKLSIATYSRSENGIDSPFQLN